MKAALALVLGLALPACAATRTGPTKAQQGYLKTHPLSPDEERRLTAREAQRGDTLDRVRVTWDGCDFERASHEGDLAIWRVHVPIDQPPIRVVTDKLEDIPSGGSALLTFKNDRLDRVTILE
ncbi:MAG TPA: hypothetical protein VN947_31560 [Polyangia bacterium]|nr:hypothetical protein [Polyangia bacterium]